MKMTVEGMMTSVPLWLPDDSSVAQTNMSEFMRWSEARYEKKFNNYSTLYEWSVKNSQEFWDAIWDFGQVRATTRGEVVLEHGELMPGARWFPEAKLNYAENLLRNPDDSEALVFWGEDKTKRRMTRRQLYDEVSLFAQALNSNGVEVGDRVAGYLPNVPEAIIAMLATASLGAIWSSASPDFGVQGALDRFAQITPKILVCTDGYFYNGKSIDALEKVRDIVAAIPSVKTVVIADYTRSEYKASHIRSSVRWSNFVAPFAKNNIFFAQLPFDHPLFILYSSGTTGVPKCIVHSHGGVLLQHLKEHQLHADIKVGDRLFYFTTCGWMMWNWLASGLASGATLMLYDGSPLINDGRVLFEFAERERTSHFGTSAKYLDTLLKANFRPCQEYGLKHLRVIMSTGSPLTPEGFEYVYRNIKSNVCLSSISGGTDIVSCFALGNPMLPVWSGELQCRGLGMAVQVFDEKGTPVHGEKGELVCTAPFPSMPMGFWNDPDGEKFHASYFERFPGVWCHGDFCELTEHDGLIIYGRSDAILNPGGVRIGTAEIYRQVEKLPEVLEAIAIGQTWQGDIRVVLFVKLLNDIILTETLIESIKRHIRDNTTPRHVPSKIVQVSDIPRTKSGKLVELAVRNIVHGEPVKNIESLANPEALENFRSRPELMS